jgi:hypothetical protein
MAIPVDQKEDFISNYEKVALILFGEIPSLHALDVWFNAETIHPSKGTTGVINILKRAIITLEKATTLYPWLKEAPLIDIINNPVLREKLQSTGLLKLFEEFLPKLAESFNGKRNKGANSAFDILMSLGQITDPKEIINESFSQGLSTLNSFERKLRQAISPIFRSFQSKLVEQIQVGGFHIVEQCFARCSTCGVNALPTDSQMDWDLFNALLYSPQLDVGTYRKSSSYPVVNLKDGEPLIYLDKEHGKTLTDVINALIFDRVVGVDFFTAGLLPYNKKRGREVLESLSKLGPFAEEVSVSVSFNFFFRNMKSIESYVAALEKTFELLSQSSVYIGATCRYDTSNKEETIKHFTPIFERFLDPIHRSSGWCMGAFLGEVCNAGRAAVSSSAKTDLPQCIRRSYKIIRPNGDVIPFCAGFGSRGASAGNVFENDAQQINAGYSLFEKELDAKIKSTPKGEHVCDTHRKWGRHIRPPRSKNPIVARPLSCQAAHKVIAL